MADINQTAAWVTARLEELGTATDSGNNVLVTNANISNYSAGNVSGTVAIANGGTGATTAAQARTNLGVPATTDFAPVAISGAYSDLTGKPVIDQTYDATSTNAQSGVAVGDALATKANKTALDSLADEVELNRVPVVGTVYDDMVLELEGSARITSQGGVYLEAQETFLLGDWYYRGSEIATKSDLTTKADLTSPAFTGTPTAPTAETSTNNTQLATTAFVHAMVDDLDYSVITDAEIEALF